MFGGEMKEDRSYICIDLKSFYASVECVERGLDPMTTNLVVADPTRTDKTICLAITPAMKALGIKNRCRVFEIPKGVDYIMAPPRMKLYMDYSMEIYNIYLKYFSEEDIHVYSVDEVFIDVTNYTKLYHLDSEEALTEDADEITRRFYDRDDLDENEKQIAKNLLGAKRIGMMLMDEVLAQTGIMATCGVGTNLYLAKIALDVTAKHAPDRVGVLCEDMFKENLWRHKPLTDFWGIGPGTAKRFAKYGITTMEEIAKADEDLIYNIFGVNAEILIDHAWGEEPVQIKDIKSYKPKANSISHTQILPVDYSFEDALIVMKEMADVLCLELVEQGLVTKTITVVVGYSNLYDARMIRQSFTLQEPSNSYLMLSKEIETVYRNMVDPKIPVRRLGLFFGKVSKEQFRQYDIFTDPEESDRERKIQEAAIKIKKRYGKNAILRGTDLQENATMKDRNEQIGGHKA